MTGRFWLSTEGKAATATQQHRRTEGHGATRYRCFAVREAALHGDWQVDDALTALDAENRTLALETKEVAAGRDTEWELLTQP